MSSTTRYKDGYREHVYVNGHRESKTFRTKREAKAWGAKREAELSQRAKAGRPTPGVLRGRCSLGAAHAGPSAMSTRALTLKSKGPWSRLSVWHHVPIKRVKAKAKGLCIVSRGATLDKPVFSHSLYKNKCFLRVSTDARHLMGAYSRASAGPRPHKLPVPVLAHRVSLQHAHAPLEQRSAGAVSRRA